MANLLGQLQELNPQIRIYPVVDKKFARYGKVHQGFQFPGLREVSLNAFPVSAPGGGYVRTLDALEVHSEAAILRNQILGQMDGEIGVCWGHNHQLGGLEWHSCHEVNIAASPLVLLLADLRDTEDNRLDANKVEAFFLDTGDTVEIFSTNMHLAPSEVQTGFNCLVVLPRGTNYPLDGGVEKKDPALFAKNKWLIAHEENKRLIDRGAPRGIYGPNWEIKPVV
jgi:hypothetical protein